LVFDNFLFILGFKILLDFISDLVTRNGGNPDNLIKAFRGVGIEFVFFLFEVVNDLLELTLIKVFIDIFFNDL
jgi:hypothetical protein